LCRKHYVEIAVDYHMQEGDQGQINFFKSELKHIEKRLNLLQMMEQETDKQGRLF
jgi:hypothetical protein